MFPAIRCRTASLDGRGVGKCRVRVNSRLAGAIVVVDVVFAGHRDPVDLHSHHRDRSRIVVRAKVGVGVDLRAVGRGTSCSERAVGICVGA